MASSNTNTDPRFDPAYQRGYAPTGTRDPSTPHTGTPHTSTPHSSTPDTGTPHSGAPAAGTPPSSTQPAPNAAMAGLLAEAQAPSIHPESSAGGPASETDESPLRSPQTHYVDDVGTLTEIAPAGRGVSLARNPWIWALWIVGGVTFLLGTVGQVVLFGTFYGPSQGPIDLIWLVPTMQSVGPALTNVGAFCLAVAMLVHALHWMRQHP